MGWLSSLVVQDFVHQQYVHLVRDKHPASQKNQSFAKCRVQQLSSHPCWSLVSQNNSFFGLVVSVGWFLQILTFFGYGWKSQKFPPSTETKWIILPPIFGEDSNPFWPMFFAKWVVLQPPTGDSNRWSCLGLQVPETKGKTLEQKLGVFERYSCLGLGLIGWIPMRDWLVWFWLDW